MMRWGNGGTGGTRKGEKGGGGERVKNDEDEDEVWFPSG